MQSQTEFRKFLTKEWHRRQKVNSRYSLRAFAGSLSISPSRLSEFLNGKGGLSASRALELIKNLNLSEDDFETVHHIIQKEMPSAKSVKAFSASELKVQKRKFKYSSSVADRNIIDRLQWPHLYIAEILSAGPLNRDQIAERLNLHPANVDQLLYEASKLHLIKPVANKQSYWQTEDSSRFFGDAKANARVRQLHFQMLRQVPEFCERSQNEQRELSSSLLQLNQQQVDKLRTMIKGFVKDCLLEADKKENLEPNDSSSLYGLAIQLFPIETKLNERKKIKKGTV